MICLQREKVSVGWSDSNQHVCVEEIARESGMRETPDHQVKRDTGSRQGKCVLKRTWLGYIRRSDWSVSEDSQYWLAGNRALALSHAHSRTFWGCRCMCALISGVRLFSRRFQWRGRHSTMQLNIQSRHRYQLKRQSFWASCLTILNVLFRRNLKILVPVYQWVDQVAT